MTATGSAGAAEPLLLARDLHKSYGHTPALDGAAFSVRAGEVVAVMGPSGSGKSTLLHCLAGIVTPDSGEVRYRGQELSAMPDAARSALRRTDFGFVFQFGQLVPELTCVENVALPLRLDRRGEQCIDHVVDVHPVDVAHPAAQRRLDTLQQAVDDVGHQPLVVRILRPVDHRQP